MVIPIQCPSEDYDAPHSVSACLSSLRQLVASFDAVADSLIESTERHSRRIDALTERIARSREKIGRLNALGSRGKALTIHSPPSHSVFQNRPAGWSSRSHNDDGAWAREDVGEQEGTVMSRARLASDLAILATIRSGREADDGLARPADSWLDRTDRSGFDEDATCALARRLRSVPSLGHNVRTYAVDASVSREILSAVSTGDVGVSDRNGPGDGGGVEEAKSVLRTDANLHELLRDRVFRHQATYWDVDGNGTHNRSPGDALSGRRGGRDSSSASTVLVDGVEDADDTVSVLTLDSSFGTAAGLTANPPQNRIRNRASRQQAKQAQEQQRRRQNLAEEAPTRRHQAASGSQPFVCELLHDAYGVGNELLGGGGTREGDAGAFYPPPRSVTELFVFHTKQPLYGVAFDGDNIAENGVVDAGKTFGSDLAAPEVGVQELSVASSSGACDRSSAAAGRSILSRSGVAGTAGTVVSGVPSFGTSASYRESETGRGEDSDKGANSSRRATAEALSTSSSVGLGFGIEAGSDGPAFAYRPRVLPDNAGQFELPANLPLSDVAYIQSAEDASLTEKGKKL